MLNIALKFAAQQGHRECLSILLAHNTEVNMAYAVSVLGVVNASPPTARGSFFLIE